MICSIHMGALGAAAESVSGPDTAAAETVQKENYRSGDYILDPRGKKITGTKKNAKIVKAGSFYYAVNAKGKILKNQWIVSKKKLYKAKKNGHLLVNETADRITFNENAVAIASKATSVRLKTVPLAESLTKSKKSKKGKLNAIWQYMIKRSNWRYLNWHKGIKKNGGASSPTWYDSAILYQLNNRRGSCLNFSAIFAALAREIGYDPEIYIGVRYKLKNGVRKAQRHSWVKIDGRYYDPEIMWNHRNGVYASRTYPHLFTSDEGRYRSVYSYRFSTGKVKRVVKGKIK